MCVLNESMIAYNPGIELTLWPTNETEARTAFVLGTHILSSIGKTIKAHSQTHTIEKFMHHIEFTVQVIFKAPNKKLHELMCVQAHDTPFSSSSNTHTHVPNQSHHFFVRRIVMFFSSYSISEILEAIQKTTEYEANKMDQKIKYQIYMFRPSKL